MVNALKKNIWPLLAGKYGKSTKRSTRRHRQVDPSKSGLEAEQIWALGALHSLGSKTKLAAGKQRETHFLINEAKEKWIEDYLEWETAVGRKRVDTTETSIKQVQDDMRNAEKAALTTTKPETTFEEMLNAIGDSLSDLATSDYEEDGEDEDAEEEDPVGGKLSNDDEPGWVMRTISSTVQYRMERFRQKQMKICELIQPGWRDAAEYVRERHRMYRMTERKVPAVI